MKNKKPALPTVLGRVREEFARGVTVDPSFLTKVRSGASSGFALAANNPTQNFLITKELLDISLDYLGGAKSKVGDALDAMVKAKSFIRLPHKKMWLECDRPFYTTSYDGARSIYGIYMEEEDSGRIAIIPTGVMEKMEKYRIAVPETQLVGVLPTSGDGLTIEDFGNMLREVNDVEQSTEAGVAYDRYMIYSAIAFLIMYNSPRTTQHNEVRAIINQNRKINSKAITVPLEGYFTRVDLSDKVKGQIKASHDAVAAAEAADKKAGKFRQYVVGHFKCRKTGMFWWTPTVRNKDCPERNRLAYKVA